MPAVVGEATLLTGGIHTQMFELVAPNDVAPVNDPPIAIASGSPGRLMQVMVFTASAVIPLFAPTSNGYHVPPWKNYTLLPTLPPNVVNGPHTKIRPSVSIATYVMLGELTPDPNALHVLVATFHLAMLLTNVFPAKRKLPTTMMFPSLSTAI